jgi:hypothetical protein
MTVDPMAELARAEAVLAEKVQRYRLVTERISTVRVSEQSPNGVRATVDAGGALLELAFDDRVRKLNPAQLAAEALACVKRAQGCIAEQVGGVVADIVGDDEPGRHIVASLRNQFPAPPLAPAAPPAPPSSPRRARPEPVSDDDFGDGFMQRADRRPSR